MSSTHGDSGSVIAERQIRREVITGRIPAGSWLRESTLARSLEISRTPIREACCRLASAGLLRWLPKRGFLARDLETEELDCVYPILVAIELLAIDSISEPLERLSAELSTINFQPAESDNDIESIYERDNRWHRRIIESTKNAVMLETHDRMADRLARYIHAYWDHCFDIARSAKEHNRIIEALNRSDLCLAAALMRSHRLQGLERIRRLMSNRDRVRQSDKVSQGGAL